MHSFIHYSLLFLILQASTNLYAMSDITPTDKVKLRPPLTEQRKSIEDSSDIIVDVKQSKPFVNMQEEKVWNFEENKDTEDSSGSDMLWISELFRLFALIIEAALWLVPLLVIFYLYKYREYWINLAQGHGFVATEKTLPDTLFGLDISQQSLPDDVAGEATRLWGAGEYRNAVSLLYRASLSCVFRKYTFELPPGATEQDCLRQVEHTGQLTLLDTLESSGQQVISAALIQHFRQLTDLWIQLAYAHHIVEDERFYTLCNDWNHLYNTEASR